LGNLPIWNPVCIKQRGFFTILLSLQSDPTISIHSLKGALMKRRSKTVGAMQALGLVLGLVALLAGPVWSQSSTGSVRGVVADQTKAVIVNASVVLTNTETNIESRTVTNNVGIYVFPAVVTGPYRLTVEAPNMQKFEGTLIVQTQLSSVVDVELKPGATAIEVVVQDVTPLMTVDSSTLGHTLERQRIEQLPLDGRLLTNLLATVPGLDPGSLRAYGMRQGANDFLLDGASLTSPIYGDGITARQPGLDTIEEFHVEVNTSSAKYTRMTNVIATTKSGTNDIHGTLFWTNRNNWYGVARARETGNSAPNPLNRNEYGGTVGGPVIFPGIYHGKNRTFWFFSYEGFKLRQKSQGSGRVPTEAMRNGDFSNLRDKAGTLQKIYDPWTTDSVTWARQQYPGNIIPQDKMSPLFKYFNQVIPMPTNSSNPLANANWYGTRPSMTDQYTISMRFDHQITSNDQVYFRYTQGISDKVGNSSRIPMLDQVGNFRTDYYPNKSGVASYRRTFSPTLFNELMMSASRESGYLATGDLNTKYADQLGLPNPFGGVGFPVLGTLGIGDSGNYFQPVNGTARSMNHFIIEDNATWIKGKHELQFGVHLRLDQNTYLPQQQMTAGSLGWASNATALYNPATGLENPSAFGNSGARIASAFLGIADYSVRMSKGRYYIRQREAALYLQDNYKFTPRLTLNLGVRWQYSPYPKEKHNLISGFDKQNRAIVIGQPLDYMYQMGATTQALVSTLEGYGAKFETPDQAGLPQHLIYDNWRDFSPHLGFAYRALDGRKSFVIRGGYSISYFPLPMWGWSDRMRMNAPFVGTYNNNYNTSAVYSPDGIGNYGLRATPTIIAGQNSTNAIEVNNPTGIELGGDSFMASYWAPNQPTPMVQDWSLTVEKEIMKDTMVRAAYVGNHASHQELYDNYNLSIPTYVWYATRQEPLPTGDLATAALHPWSNNLYGDLQEWQNSGWGNYSGAQFEIERRYSKGFGFQVFYNVGNTLRAGGYGWYSSVAPTSTFLPGQVPDDFQARTKQLLYARDTSIPKHMVRWNWIVDLPFGKNKLIGKNWGGVLNQIAGGWQVTGMGMLRGTHISLNNGLYPTGNPYQYYGHKYPIQDCTSGECVPGYLLYNGYIPAYQINKPDGIMGVPADYKPAVAPLNPYPANYPDINPDTDPMYNYYGTNTVWVTLKDGTRQEVDYTGSGDTCQWGCNQITYPLMNQFTPSTRLWNTDASLVKNFTLRENLRLRIQFDFFNLFNHPNNDWDPNGTGNGQMGIIYTNENNYDVNGPRTMQFSARLSW
jgi:hypothetical protein